MTEPQPQNSEYSEWGIQLVRVRADGSRISISEVAEYFERIRVAAAIQDGEDIGQAGLVVITVLVDSSDDVIRADGVDREPLSSQALTRSVLHHFNTIAVFEDAIVDHYGNAHSFQDPPEDLSELLELASSEIAAPVVHAFVGHDSISTGFLAAAAQSPVHQTFVENFTIVLDPSGKSSDTSVDLASRSELPSATLVQMGEVSTIRAKVRAGRRTCTFIIRNMAPRQTLVATFSNPEIEAALPEDTRLFHEAGADVPAELAVPLLGIEPDSPTFFAEALALMGLPAVAANWLHGIPPESDITIVEPKSTGEILKDSILSEFNDEASDPTKALGKFRGFLRRRPVISIAYGLAEIVLGLVVILYGDQLFNLWTWLWWTIGLIWIVDGLATAGWAILLLRNRIRATQPDPPAHED